MFFSNPKPQSVELRKIFRGLAPEIWHSFWITLVVTVISLGSVVYMMQVYDRVVSTRSMGTLLSLTIAVIASYAVGEILEVVRKRLMQRSSMKLEIALSERIFRALHKANLIKVPGIYSQQIRDVSVIRDFLSSPAMMTLLELPTSILFIILMFIINPQMGYFSILGLAIQVLIAWINATKVDPQLRKAQSSAFVAMYYAHETMRNAQIMHALGMSRNLENLWLGMQKKMMAEQGKASDVGGTVMSSTKFITLTQSSLLLGIGALLTLYGVMPASGSMIIVASIIGGKALQPIAQLLGSWRMLTEARLAFERIEHVMVSIPANEVGMPLPTPKGQLTVENLVMAAPSYPVPIIRGINFTVPKGATLVIIGASASGKSTLTRALMGVWPAASGKVRLDGVDIYQWNKDELGQHIGYLPQDVDLFDGTVAENIARFGEVNLDHIEEICKLIGIHEVIMSLPNGYQSNIGDEGVTLSGGQKQRVGLARALYGYPKFIVMDEPNSNLDDVGEAALISAIAHMKTRGTTQVIVTHRPAMIQQADILMVMHQGLIRMFGPPNEVMAAIQKANEEAAAKSAAQNPPAALPQNS
jgi:ATP-binding cassette subfamily C exporter for protease/lipase